MTKFKITTNRSLLPFFPLVDALGQALGKNCEVVLHDLADFNKSVVKIANGHVTGRKVGSPITDLGLRLIAGAMKQKQPDSIISYKTQTNRGSELKSTTILIRNDKGDVAGCLCINMDITSLLSTKNILEDICSTVSADSMTEEDGTVEKFENSVNDLINNLLNNVIKNIGKPVAFMNKEEKLHIIRELKKDGLFLIKGSIRKISKALNVSIPTIYKYLEQI
jgi:predicted transcriptional regulator YheO